jgi:hypothetical protein
MTQAYDPRVDGTREETVRSRRRMRALAYAWGRNDQGYRNTGGGQADSFAFAHYYLTVDGEVTLRTAWEAWVKTSRMNDAQRRVLVELCDRYGVTFDESLFASDAFGLPAGSVSGQVGPIHVGVDGHGRISW